MNKREEKTEKRESKKKERKKEVKEEKERGERKKDPRNGEWAEPTILTCTHLSHPIFGREQSKENLTTKLAFA